MHTHYIFIYYFFSFYYAYFFIASLHPSFYIPAVHPVSEKRFLINFFKHGFLDPLTAPCFFFSFLFFSFLQ